MHYIFVLLSIAFLIGGFHFRKKAVSEHLEQVDSVKTAHFEQINNIELDRRLTNEDMASLRRQYADINKDYMKSKSNAINAYWRKIDEQTLVEEDETLQNKQKQLVNLDIKQKNILRERKRLQDFIEKTEAEQRQMQKNLTAKIRANQVRLDMVKQEEKPANHNRMIRRYGSSSASNVRFQRERQEYQQKITLLTEKVHLANDALRRRHEEEMEAKDKIIADTRAAIDRLDQAFDNTDRAGAIRGTRSRTPRQRFDSAYSAEDELKAILETNDGFRKKHELHTRKTEELKTRETQTAAKLRENSDAKRKAERSLKNDIDNLDKQYDEQVKSITTASIAGCIVCGFLSLFGFMKTRKD